ncbi:MAG: hypothetical protein IEMM0006_1093 [bacterium]|nr:MAG: hypothetical protein IEMM0006_1093 [bacterium]
MNRDFGEKLTTWYAQNKRHLPWRNIRNPYKIWLSEIILQQTRVNQGMAYYHRFVEAWPDVFSLAKASEVEVYNLWQGLGYYNRAGNLMKTAKIIAGQYNGKFPEDFETLKTLPGIGDYTAAAIASLAFGKKYPAVEGNVYRQQLTHLKVSACFIPVFLKESLNNGAKKSLSLVRQKQLTNFPVPRLIARYLQDKNIIK